MHPNPAFRQETGDRNLELARERGFGTLAVNGSYGPMLSHVPFKLSDDGTSLEMHLVRSNPIARLGEPVPAVMSVSGPDAYISPDWYGVDDQVPTWNYVAVHLRGVLSPAQPDTLRDHLDRVSERFEGTIPSKTPWTTDKMDDDVMARMMRQILPFTMTVEEVSGTWKLNQNKPDEVRLKAADGVDAYGHGSETALLAALMRGVPSKDSQAG